MQIEKFNRDQVRGILSHNNRININDANTDIDENRTCENYSLTPYINIEREEYQNDKKAREEVRRREWDYFKHRLSELYVYPRSDVAVLAGCVVSLPEELIGQPEKAEAFFSATAEFLCKRYGGDRTEDGREYSNVISITVHYDEKQISGSEGLRGHLHFEWIPAVKIDKEVLMQKKNHIKLMEYFDYKVSAKEVINKRDLETLHQDLAEYLKANQVEGQVLNKSAGSGKNINIPVSQLKDYTDRTGKTIDKELLKDLTVDRLVEALERDQRPQQRGWEYEWDRRDEWTR